MNYVDHVTDENNVVHTLVDPGGRDMQKVAGAYNLLETTEPSGVYTGVTFTRNADGSYTGNGTATDSVFFLIATVTDASKIAGLKYICTPPDVDDPSLIWGSIEGSFGTIGDRYGNECIVPSNATGTARFYLRVGNGKQCNNVTFKPMLTTDLTATYDDYVPYVMSNRELTDTDSLSLANYASSGFYSYGNAIRYGRIVSINGIWAKSDGTGVSKPTFITGLPAAWRPRANMQGTGVIIQTDESVVFDMPSIHTDGSIVVTSTSALVTRGNFSIVYTL